MTESISSPGKPSSNDHDDVNGFEQTAQSSESNQKLPEILADNDLSP